jgi:serine/threonine protein kinase/Rieske Fe-S protein
MQALSADQLVGQILGNYRIERFLGKGRLNAVYLGRHLASQKLDALTMYLVPAHFSVEANARFLTRFRKESAAIIKLDHQYILPIYESGEYAGTPYLVTPYVNQGSLADMLKRHGRYDHREVVPILEQIASGVAYAHNRSCIHGTLRPSNLVVRDEDTLQVAGFGLMHMLQLSGIEKSEQPYAHLLTVAQTFLASPEYIAPEIVQGQVIDVRSDIYALGCILFELLSGRPPFSGSDPLEVARMHVTQSIPSLHIFCPEVPIALTSVVNQALERDPARRFQHVEELKEAFIQGSRGASAKGSQGRRYAEDERDWAETVQMAERVQETPADGYRLGNTNKWQLLPPIVTGKLSAVPFPTPQGLFSTSSKMVDREVNTSPGGRSNRGVSRPERYTDQQTLPPIAPASDQQTSQRYQNQPAAPTWPPLAAAPTWPPLAAETPVSASAASQTFVPERGNTRPTYRQETFNEPARAAPNLPASENIIARDATAWSENNQAAPAGSNMAMNSMPGMQEDTSRLVQSYSWWSQPGAQNIEVREERVKNARAQTQPQSQAQPAPLPSASSREPLFLRNSDTVSWMSEPVVPENVRRNFAAPTQKKGKMSRRRAIAFLASGGVVAAGTVGVLNLKHLLPTNQTPTAHTQTNAAANVAHTNTQPQKTQAKTTTTTQKTGTQNTGTQNTGTGTTQNTGTQGQNGKVIGSTKQATNTAVTFANPANDTPALLVRLTSGTFVAYEQACTHQGVLVNYDPAKKLLVCPAHGAIFDPANGGAVVQGPAQQPIPKVNVQVQANGTITTA